jgi:protein-S-isoprenylcysteine O-methyltransferase Ste14
MPHNLPALIVGLIVGAYWGRVVQLMRKARRRVGKLANVIPPERIGRIIRIFWFPVIGLWIVLPILGGVSATNIRALEPLWISPLMQWPALAIAMVAYLLTLVCWQKMGRSLRLGIDPEEKTTLIVKGPYSRIRHPIYALSSLFMLATAAVWPSPAMLVIAVIHLIFLQSEARREEANLLRVHGDVYREYCAKTGRFLPKVFG